jgi:hypothetical protein
MGGAVHRDLKSGASIDIKPLQDLKGKDRARFERAVRFELPVNDEGELDRAMGVALRLDGREVRRNAAIACFITAWSFDLPVPGLDDLGRITSAESIGDYPIDDELELDEILQPYLDKLRRPDPKETTTSSSNGRSKATARSLQG